MSLDRLKCASKPTFTDDEDEGASDMDDDADIADEWGSSGLQAKTARLAEIEEVVRGAKSLVA